MIKGDRLIINQKGISISEKKMQEIRIYKGSQVHILPFRTFEFRPKESGTQFPVDIFLTPIPPEKWPFVMRFNIRLTNRPGTFRKVYKFLEKLHINVISSETIRSGHHHDTLNVLGVVTRLEIKSLKRIFKELKSWKEDRGKIYKTIYSGVYNVKDLTHYFAGKKYRDFKKNIIEKMERAENSEQKQKFKELLKKIDENLQYSEESDKYYFNFSEINRIYKSTMKEDLNHDYYAKVPMNFVKKDISEENGEKANFHTPMWYDIIEAYVKKTEELEDGEFHENVQRGIDDEYKTIKKRIARFLKEDSEEKSSHKKGEENNKYEEDLVKNFREYAWKNPEKKEINDDFGNFVPLLIDHLRKDYEINRNGEELSTIIEVIGIQLDLAKDETKGSQEKHKFYKQLVVLTKLILESLKKIKFCKLEKDADLKKILENLEEELENLHKNPGDASHNEFNEKLGVYLAYRYRDANEITIEELLEAEIKRARPKVFKLKSNKSIEPGDKHFLIQKEMLILKAILSALVTYKKMLSYRFKLLLVEDSLEYDKCKYEPEDFINLPTENYIYNIQYYKHILRYPYFANRAILHSSLHNPFWKLKMLNVIDRLKRLPQESSGDWDVEPASDLDPITISALEMLSHASYHRVYEKDFTVKADDSFIPFPSRFPTELLNDLFPAGNLSTYGIASFNSEALTCRICPIPISKLHRFAEIQLTKTRSCHEDCVKQGKENLKELQKKYLQQMKKRLKENEGEDMEDNSIFVNYDHYISEEAACGSEGDLDSDIYCNGSSMGLMSTWLKGLSRPIDPEEKYGFNFNIWRTFNKTTLLDDQSESGDITVWAQAIKKDFLRFPPDINSLIRENFNANLQKKFPHGHLRGENIKVDEFSSSRIFVSLPFQHPMRKEWLTYITRVGKQSGFSEIKATETYTKPVTEEVGRDIRNSIAMIQILSFPGIDDEKNQGLEWLYAEYLTAVNLGIVVIRLVDNTTIKDGVHIGRDHMTFEFSRLNPFSDFEKQVDRAFAILKKELLDIYKI